MVLTIGEATTQEAINRLHDQSMRPADILVVRDVRPMHRALNLGATRVKTPFFVQVDADMLLDGNCIAVLRNSVRPGTGIVVGYLRDAMVREVVGVKLFRTSCFGSAAFPDTISPDTDFVNEIARAGWKTTYVGKAGGDGFGPPLTLGEHRPDYSPSYTYSKYLLEGCRYRYRHSAAAFRWHMGRLAASRHPSAVVAQIGLARGMFVAPGFDLLGLPHSEVEFERLEPFLSNGSGGPRSTSLAPVSADQSLEELFRDHYRRGAALFAQNDYASFCQLLQACDTFPDNTGWIFKVALCRGLLAEAASDAAIAADYEALKEFAIELAIWSDAAGDTSLDAVTAHAAAMGLKTFALDGSIRAHYRAVETPQGTVYRETGRAVQTGLAANGRPRIALPFRLGGHLFCAHPEHLRSVRWCLDLMRSGYAFVHVPGALGPRKVSLVEQTMTNLFDRLLPQGARTAHDIDTGRRSRAALKRLARQRQPSYRPLAEKILMVAGDLGRGGSERQTLATATGLRRRGFDVRVVVLCRTPPGTPSFDEEFVKLGIVPLPAADFVLRAHAGFRPVVESHLAADLSNLVQPFASVVRQLCVAIRQHRPQVVHAWLDRAGLAAALAATSLGVPRVVVHYGSIPPYDRDNLPVKLRESFQALAANPHVALVNNSMAGAAAYDRWLGLKSGTVRVLHNGYLDESVATEEIAAYRARLGLTRDTLVVGTVIRFVHDKDPDLWLAAAAEIARVRPDVRFVLAGYGVLLDQSKRRAEALGLAGRVIFTGPVEDVTLIYRTLDVFLLTSRVEGLPNVLIEAQSSGCPVVTTDVGGTAEAFIEGVTGRAVRERSPEALAAAVLEMLADPDWRARARAHAPALITDRFGLERMIDRTLEIYGIAARASADRPARPSSPPPFPPPQAGKG